MAQGEVIEVDSGSEGENDEPLALSATEMIQMCEKLEKASLCSGLESSLDVSQTLRCFHAQLVQRQVEKAKQVTLESIWQRLRN